ncbi:MAG: polysaccharide deacetylase family protein [Algoriphagus aquaeductus]|uniref:polysaccharide deacetylase family protein n=1 Tax=Algoriphagus aquaeductus TaxID=475299 RepID=UPI0038792B70
MNRWFITLFLTLGTGLGFSQEISLPMIPALSYHNVRTFTSQDPAYFITPEEFEKQVKKLKEAGFQTVLPKDFEEGFLAGKKKESKSVMISFDDTRADHYASAAPILEKYGFRGAFFITTVSIGKPGYMNREQIRDLSDRGHAIGLHTWDHQDLRKIAADQWEIQIDRPKALLEEITGKKVTSLAYPFGLWNPEVIRQIKARGLKSAFQLGGKADPNDPIYSLPRILVPGNWSGDRLLKEIESRF